MTKNGNDTLIFFVGSGPGDPDLLTIKARKLLEKARIVLFHGSLVAKEILDYAESAEVLHDCSLSDLEEQREYYLQAHEEKKLLVRLHSGDPAIYGALQEQADFLEEKGIAYEVVPGVSSLFAAAATLGRELTVPQVSQTVIITRAAGRTPVPDAERLSSLASHGATMVIFLSANLADQVQEELLSSYSEETPVAIVAEASRKTERIFHTDIASLAATLKDNGINKTALILVGNVLDASGKRSLLYDSKFAHAFRETK